MNLGKRFGRYLEETSSLREEVKLWKQRFEEKDQDLQAAVMAHSADIAAEKVKRKELGALVERLELEVAMEKSGRVSDQAESSAAREEIEAKAAVCVANVINELDKSIPVLRIEAARSFIKSRTYLERKIREFMKEQGKDLAVTLGQVKNKGYLKPDFDHREIKLWLDENYEEPVDDEPIDTRILEDDEFYSLVDFNPSSELDKDSFSAEIDRIKEMSSSELREAGINMPSGGSVNSDILDSGKASVSGTKPIEGSKVPEEKDETSDSSTPSLE
jgi:hypothetical protein